MHESCLFVFNIHPDVDEHILEELFSQIGSIDSLNLDANNNSAVIRYESEEDVLAAMLLMSDTTLFGYRLHLSTLNNDACWDIYKRYIRLVKEMQITPSLFGCCDSLSKRDVQKNCDYDYNIDYLSELRKISPDHCSVRITDSSYGPDASNGSFDSGYRSEAVSYDSGSSSHRSSTSYHGDRLSVSLNTMNYMENGMTNDDVRFQNRKYRDAYNSHWEQPYHAQKMYREVEARNYTMPYQQGPNHYYYNCSPYVKYGSTFNKRTYSEGDDLYRKKRMYRRY